MLVKNVEQDGNTLRLTTFRAAMVVGENEKVPICRNVYIDQNEVLWCMYKGRYVKVRKIDGSKLKSGHRSREVYEIF